jgi:hypothetical protein
VLTNVSNVCINTVMSTPATRESRGKSRSRLLKINCDSCGMILRGSAAALSAGMPACSCGGSFEVADLASLEKVDPALFLERVQQLPLGEHNALMRELGYDGAVIKRKCDENRRAPARCKHVGCGAFRPAGKLYCAKHAAEHDPLPF